MRVAVLFLALLVLAEARGDIRSSGRGLLQKCLDVGGVCGPDNKGKTCCSGALCKPSFTGKIARHRCLKVPIVEVAAPSVQFATSITGITADAFNSNTAATVAFCNGVVAASGYPADLAKCTAVATDVAAARRRLHQTTTTVVDTTIVFEVTSADQIAVAEQFADNFAETIATDAAALDATFSDVSNILAIEAEAIAVDNSSVVVDTEPINVPVEPLVPGAPPTLPPSAPTSVSTAAVAGHTGQRTVTWSIDNAAAQQITGFTVTCTSTTDIKYYVATPPYVEFRPATETLTVAASATSAVVGATVALPAASYICSVKAINAAGNGIATSSDVFKSGCACGADSFELLPPVSVDAPYEPQQCWFKDENMEQGVTQVVDLASEGLVDYQGNLVTSTPDSTTSAIKLQTRANNTADKAGASYAFAASGMLGKKFSDIINDPNFSINYSWFKKGPCTLAGEGCQTAPAPALKLQVYAPNANNANPAVGSTSKYSLLVWEPYFNPSQNFVAANLDRWVPNHITKTTGSDFGFNTTAGNGWYVTGSGWGSSTFKNANRRRSLGSWATYWASLDASLQDAVIVKIQVQVGRGNAGITSYASDMKITTSDGKATC